MLLVSDIVSVINGNVCSIIDGVKTYGIAKQAEKGETFAPYANGEYVGIDDTYPAQIYHKELTVSSSPIPRSGFGDNEQSLQNIYGMAMIVYFNEKKCGLPTDKLYTFIQSSITGVLKAEGYRTIRVSVSNAILNDGQVWVQEYGTSQFKLSGPQRLIQINYSIVIVFDKECISLPNCKN